MCVYVCIQGSADSNYSQHSSDLSLEEETESRHRENERHALAMLEKARVCITVLYQSSHPKNKNNNKN